MPWWLRFRHGVTKKTHSTNINHALGGSIAIGTFLFFIIGWVGAMAYHIDPNGDILSAINAQSTTRVSFARISVYLFPLSVIATSIPIYSIIVRYNLLENKVCNKPVANFIAVILPWIVVIPFYCGQGLSDVINWSTLISNGIVNFIVPFLIYVKARMYKLSLQGDQRALLDEPFEDMKEPDEPFCFGRINLKGQPPAPPHFVFGNIFKDTSYAPLIISLTFVVSLTVAVVGVVIINLLDAFHIP